MNPCGQSTRRSNDVPSSASRERFALPTPSVRTSLFGPSRTPTPWRGEPSSDATDTTTASGGGGGGAANPQPANAKHVTCKYLLTVGCRARARPASFREDGRGRRGMLSSSPGPCPRLPTPCRAAVSSRFASAVGGRARSGSRQRCARSRWIRVISLAGIRGPRPTPAIFAIPLRRSADHPTCRIGPFSLRRSIAYRSDHARLFRARRGSRALVCPLHLDVSSPFVPRTLRSRIRSRRSRLAAWRRGTRREERVSVADATRRVREADRSR